MTPERAGELLKDRNSRGSRRLTLLVHRTRCYRKKDGKISRVLLRCAAPGIVFSGSDEDRRQLPEKDRAADFINVCSTFDLSEGKKLEKEKDCFITADIIEPVAGYEFWRVVRSKYRKENGFYQALAVRTDEDPYIKVPEKEEEHEKSGL